MGERRFYTKRIMQVIAHMQRDGATNKQIAMAIGTTENRLSSRLCQLRIKRKPAEKTTSVRIASATYEKFTVEALQRKTTTVHLIRDLLDHIAEDKLFGAVLGDR